MLRQLTLAIAWQLSVAISSSQPAVAGDSVEPGVERSATPGSSTQKTCRARGAGDSGNDKTNPLMPLSAASRALNNFSFASKVMGHVRFGSAAGCAAVAVPRRQRPD